MMKIGHSRAHIRVQDRVMHPAAALEITYVEEGRDDAVSYSVPSYACHPFRSSNKEILLVLDRRG